MSKIEVLIEQLCPDGVEFTDVETLIENKSITTVSPPYKLTKNLYQAFGIFPIIDQGQDFIVGYTDNEKVIIDKGLHVIFGDHTEVLKYVDFAFAQGADGIKIIKTNQEFIIAKYFYYALINFYIKTGKYTRHFSFVKKTSVPIPPLPIQKEIVNILDKFTRLEAELQAELEARQKQYEYYRNELLSFEGKDVEWKMLGEVSKIRRGTAITEKETIPGEFPVVANAPNPTYFHGKSNRSGETIVIARSGAYSGLVSYWNKPFFLTDAFSIHPDNNLFKTKFVYFFLKSDQKKIHLMKKGSGVPHVRANDFESYSIPLPPLAEQERIVSILDKFDKLVASTSSATEGLPAEIAARRKQYEYYRGKLLDFKPLTINH